MACIFTNGEGVFHLVNEELRRLLVLDAVEVLVISIVRAEMLPEGMYILIIALCSRRCPMPPEERIPTGYLLISAASQRAIPHTGEMRRVQLSKLTRVRTLSHQHQTRRD